jgi:hypothetical protein
MSLNSESITHFFLHKDQYDFKLSISIEGKNEIDRREIMDSLYIELEDHFDPYPIPIDINVHRTTKIIFLKKNYS